MADEQIAVERDVALASHTNIGLGGPAAYFVAVQSVEELRQALGYAREHNLPAHILAGGTNTIFPDDGFSGLVIKVDLKGLAISEDGLVTAAAGESWDSLVQETIKRGLAGFETMSGVPGSVGATPIQNVGAYGQEVSQTIQTVRAIDRETLDDVSFTAAECQFGYRTSRFKAADAGRYVITEVVYQLRPQGEPTLTYPQLVEALADGETLANLAPGEPQLAAVRDVVLVLRRKKSMVIDPSDLNSKSCGSFFVNPVLSAAELEQLTERWHMSGGDGEVPTFVDSDDGDQRVPAAWLIEQAGFQKGERRGGVGISANHPLALVNYDGTTAELLALADEIIAAVETHFGITLTPEPVIVSTSE